MKENVTELSISTMDIQNMIAKAAGNLRSSIDSIGLVVSASESYGPMKNRVWTFFAAENPSMAFGAIERCWGGLKMIVSIAGGSPRVHFFTESGDKTNIKSLKEAASRNG